MASIQAFGVSDELPLGNLVGVTAVEAEPLAPWLTPEGFAAPRVGAVLREASAVAEAGRFALGALERRRRAAGRRTPVRSRAARDAGDPGAGLPRRRQHARARWRGCCASRATAPTAPRSTSTPAAPSTPPPSSRADWRSIALRRGTRVQIVGHSLGGMLARGLAVRRPDLVAGIVTLGSPMLAPGAHHASLTRSVEMLVRLSRAGWPGLMSEDCVAGDCARQSFDESRAAAAGRRRVHRDLLQARRHRRLAGLHRPARHARRGHRLARRPGLRPAGDQRGAGGPRALRGGPRREPSRQLA